jgi:aryl-alcohol dehydrogenase-like predicted oxidoreductase
MARLPLPAQKVRLSPLFYILFWYLFIFIRADGDGVILGASKPEQFDTSLKDLEKGPLPADVVAYIEKLWEKVKADSPPYHF